VKLAPGSDDIKLGQVVFTVNTKDKTSTLRYRGTNGLCIKNSSVGYYTRQEEMIGIEVKNGTWWYNLTEDVDHDGNYSDRVKVGDGGTHIEFDFTSSSANVNYSITNIGTAGDASVELNHAEARISSTNITFGKVQVNGTATANSTLPANSLIVVPYLEGDGYFTAEYLQTGTNWIDGNLQRGDIIKMCYESPQDIGEDIEMRLNFIPKIGSATLTEFVTPDVISTERTYLYP